MFSFLSQGEVESLNLCKFFLPLFKTLLPLSLDCSSEIILLKTYQTRLNITGIIKAEVSVIHLE